MTLSLYLQCCLMYLLGQAVDLFLTKVPEYKKLYLKANEEFMWKRYWQSDWYLILGTQAFGAMLILGLDQVIAWKPAILEYVKWFFGGIGWGGSSFILSKWSACKKYIEGVIDFKTNKADAMPTEPPSMRP